MSTSYRVLPGDTLSSIARRTGCSPQSLQSLNKISNPRALREGANIQLPDTREKAQTKVQADQNRQPTARPDKTKQRQSWFSEFFADAPEMPGTYLKVARIGHSLSESVLQWLREVESTELVHKEAKADAKQRPADKRKRSPSPGPSANAAKRHKDQVIADLKQRLLVVPVVVETSGVTLTRNERRMIVAAVGLCEVNGDVFGSRNTDQEFVGRKFGKRGIETSYSRIVHIGLSYGYIQYTQDGGGLGKLLTWMRGKDERAFERYFPNPDALIALTTTGLPDKDEFGKSGQAYWNELNKSKKGKSQKTELQSRANTDADKDNAADKPLTADEQVRGARVQKIPYIQGYPAIDLWEDYAAIPKLPIGAQADYPGFLSAFKAAGDVPVFQDVQIDLAVEDYMNPCLAHCKEWNIRSAIGLAFVVACSVRGGAGGALSKLLSRIAKAKLGITRFDSSTQERECLDAIAAKADAKAAKVEVAGIEFDRDEARRAKLILKDEYHFLKEDLYDTGTFDAAHDK